MVLLRLKIIQFAFFGDEAYCWLFRAVRFSYISYNPANFSCKFPASSFLVYYIVLTVLFTTSEAKYGDSSEQFCSTYFYDGKPTDDDTTGKEEVQDTFTNLSLLKNEDLLPSDLYQSKSRCSEILE